jgi:hypothetical protein
MSQNRHGGPFLPMKSDRCWQTIRLNDIRRAQQLPRHAEKRGSALEMKGVVQNGTCQG